MWKYNGEEIKEISQFPHNTFGFVYSVLNKKTGKAYIGKKVLYHNIKKKLTKNELAEIEGQGRRPSYRLTIKESDWKTYWGSNKLLLEELKTNKDNFERIIIQLTQDKKQLTYFETKYLFVYSVLEKPEEFYNDNILGKFYTKDFMS
jgi:ubiquinone biosynthesis protein Coq4